jgi:hypothetical protein
MTNPSMQTLKFSAKPMIISPRYNIRNMCQPSAKTFQQNISEAQRVNNKAKHFLSTIMKMTRGDDYVCSKVKKQKEWSKKMKTKQYIGKMFHRDHIVDVDEEWGCIVHRQSLPFGSFSELRWGCLGHPQS